MAESQNIEWKESWRDEYLKWICGFANAQGGKIYIGTRDVSDPKASNRHTDGLDVGLEKELIKIILENPKIIMVEIAKKLNVTKRTIERIVKSLRENKIIERKGGKRYGYWEVRK